ncbi:hypothetical protein V1477_008258 [Vespula maculifrons]|uniref:Uncharacterized protein n=1 Tax=Vespula maculifrons TaxID=7453 RepID=A0ABD2CDD5_VESMC
MTRLKSGVSNCTTCSPLHTNQAVKNCSIKTHRLLKPDIFEYNRYAKLEIQYLVLITETDHVFQESYNLVLFTTKSIHPFIERYTDILKKSRAILSMALNSPTHFSTTSPATSIRSKLCRYKRYPTLPKHHYSTKLQDDGNCIVTYLVTLKRSNK